MPPQYTCGHCGAAFSRENKGRVDRFCSRTCASHSRTPVPLEARFWEKVQKTESCWLWTGSRNRRGYGKIGVRLGRNNHHMDYAHRVSWEIHHGAIPAGMDICHHCDNPPCVNPSHLFLGTRLDNIIDATRKGRTRQGSRHEWTVLTDSQVVEIIERRRRGEKLASIAADFGISLSYVGQLATGARPRGVRLLSPTPTLPSSPPLRRPS